MIDVHEARARKAFLDRSENFWCRAIRVFPCDPYKMASLANREKALRDISVR
jgi:hypothetical protein